MADENDSRKNVLNSDAPQILWKDRKRYLGLPISFTRYEVDGERFTSRIGLLRTETNEVLLYRILDLKLSRTLGQKLFGVGTIILYTADQSDNQIVVKNIANSEKVRRFLSTTIEEERNKRRIIGRELYGAAMPPMMDTDGDGFPDIQ